MMNDSVSAPADVPSTMVEPVNTTSVGKGRVMVNNQAQHQAFVAHWWEAPPPFMSADDVPSTAMEPGNTTSMGERRAMVNSQTSVQMSAAYVPTSMMDPRNAKKGVKNLLVEKKGPTHPKKARIVDGKKNLHKQHIFDTRRRLTSRFESMPFHPLIQLSKSEREGEWKVGGKQSHS